ncbi:hypothetical protein ORIO_19405 [Cereibacter azotoformans]|uniref:hypothetical protein n=1 Tax=Cereibacter azotoformans TaxID=43057 RepID=UPI0005C62808|nr:hypothetical protein [Cereibacter azotoformans]ULB11990.1 hypothetical protein ORIO_19405 [Cereibacter azotoformans]
MTTDPAILGGLLPAAGALALLIQGGRRSLRRRAERRDAKAETATSRSERSEVFLHWILLILGLGAIFGLGALI